MKKLAVVVGHTKAASGAYSDTLRSSEYPWNSDLAARILAIRSMRLECRTFFRDTAGISGAYVEGERWGADAFVELHFNSSHNITSTGTGVLYQTSLSKPFAFLLFQEISDVLRLAPWPGRSSGVSTPYQASGAQERGKSSLTASRRPTALIEPFFGSNPKDSKIAQANKDGLAQAVFRAAESFLR